MLTTPPDVAQSWKTNKVEAKGVQRFHVSPARWEATFRHRGRREIGSLVKLRCLNERNEQKRVETS